jgi:hypothetical protein
MKKAAEPLDIWTIYFDTSDYPNAYVARRFVVNAAGHAATNDMFVAATLDELRALLSPGLTRIPRFDNDDPVIVEVWL